MSWNLEDAGSQDGRVAIVTGANAGLGLETARALAESGCEVILACRNADKAAAAREQIIRRQPGARLACMTLDLSRLVSVSDFAQKFKRRYQRLDLLINNAGIMMPPFALSEDGFESQLATNYLGHFALTGRLLPRLLATSESRVVSVSSLAHRWSPIRLEDPHFANGYDARLAYGQSKLACLMFAYELDRRLCDGGHRTLSVAAHPGVSVTNLADHFPLANALFKTAARLVLQSAAAGAQPLLYAALAAEVEGGDYCGPLWLNQWRGPPGKVGSNRRSKDPAVAAQLWSLSEQATGVAYLS